MFFPLFFRNDIFVFLLSTRAGGLGINLTAADTVSDLRERAGCIGYADLSSIFHSSSILPFLFVFPIHFFGWLLYTLNQYKINELLTMCQVLSWQFRDKAVKINGVVVRFVWGSLTKQIGTIVLCRKYVVSLLGNVMFLCSELQELFGYQWPW